MRSAKAFTQVKAFFLTSIYTSESSPAGTDLLTSSAQDSLVSVMSLRAYNPVYQAEKLTQQKHYYMMGEHAAVTFIITMKMMLCTEFIL